LVELNSCEMAFEKTLQFQVRRFAKYKRSLSVQKVEFHTKCASQIQK
jgi:hypothetical protein